MICKNIKFLENDGGNGTENVFEGSRRTLGPHDTWILSDSIIRATGSPEERAADCVHSWRKEAERLRILRGFGPELVFRATTILAYAGCGDPAQSYHRQLVRFLVSNPAG